MHELQLEKWAVEQLGSMDTTGDEELCIYRFQNAAGESDHTPMARVRLFNGKPISDELRDRAQLISKAPELSRELEWALSVNQLIDDLSNGQSGHVVQRERLGGLLNYYYRDVA